MPTDNDTLQPNCERCERYPFGKLHDGLCLWCITEERDRLLASMHKIHLMTYAPAVAEACVALECAKKANAVVNRNSQGS